MLKDHVHCNLAATLERSHENQGMLVHTQN